MGRLSQPLKAPASKQQRPSLLSDARLAAALGRTGGKTRSPASASRLSLGLLGASKVGKQSPKGKLPSRFSLGLGPPPPQHGKARGRKTAPFSRPAANVFKLSPQRGGRKSMPGLGGGAGARTSALFGGAVQGFAPGIRASSDEGGSNDESLGTESSSGGSEGDSEGEGGSGTSSDEDEVKKAGNPALQSDIFVPDPAFEKQMVRAINRGPLVQGPAQELASFEQNLAQSNEMAKGLFIDDLGGEMTAELLKTIEAMEQRVQIGVNSIRQGKEKAVKELEANFEQQRTTIARLGALQDRLLASRKALSLDLGKAREETSARLDSLQRNYHDSSLAIKKPLADVGGKKGGNAGGKER